MPAYVPPALRGVAGQQAEGHPRLSERIWKITLEYSSGGPFDVAECPESLSEHVESDQTSEVTVRNFELPSGASTGELRALLNWFLKASSVPSEQHPHGDARCQMLFPPTLSKDARKHIHQLAQTLRLPTFSKGVGEERRLMVHGVAFRETPEMEAEVAAVTARRRVPAAVRERARQIWKWCQADGGALWALSLGEIEESLLAAPDEAALPPGVKDLLERREHGAALIAAIRAGDTATALAVLDAHPRAAWIRDDDPAAGAGADTGPGYYPLHLGALAGMGEVVDRIANQPGAVEQRDRNYATPLKVAKKAGQAAMVEILLRHGAKDYEINQAAHKTAAMGIPVPPGPPGSGRRLSNSQGGSPHVGSPATASSPHTAAGSLGSSYMAAHAASRQRRMSGDGIGGGGGGRGAQPPHGGQQQHGQQHHGHGHQPHGPSSLGPGQTRGSGSGHGGGRRSIDEQHPPTSQHHHQHPHAHPVVGAASAAADPTLNPFAVLAAGDKSAASSRRSSAGGLPPRPQPGDGASDSDGSAGAGGRGHGGRGNGGGSGGRTRAANNRCQLPPIQSGEISEMSVMAALAAMGGSAKPGLPTAAEAPDEAGCAAAAAGSDDDDDDGEAGAPAAGAAAGDEAPKKRKTRRGRRGRGSRRHSAATADEITASAVAAAATAVAAAAGEAAAPPPQVLPLNRAAGPASVGAESSDRSAVTDGSDSDGSASGSKMRRGGQPARARRHERRRAARVSGADGGSCDRAGGGSGGGNGRRSSGAEYASFHHGHARSGGGGGGAGSHYHVYGGTHHGHANDAASWRRNPAAAPSSAAPPAAAAMAPASPLRLRGGPDEPRQPAAAAARPPAPRRMSGGPGVPGAVAGTPLAPAVPGGAPAEAPGSPFHVGGAHGPREHVAAGPAAGVGFGFGRGRGRGLPPAAPGAPGGGVPSAPGSPLRPPVGASPPPPPPPAAAAAAAGGSAAAL